MNKTTIILTIMVLSFAQTVYAQQASTNHWDKWKNLIGEWVGEGSGQPGQGGGTFSFQTDLDGKILVRKSHSEYPAAQNKPAVIHDDLMIIYLDFSGTPSKAIYFDNEGHIINYSIAYSDRSIVLTSDEIQNLPVFRLTYALTDNKTVNVKFEISSQGNQEDFKTYVEGKSKKKN